MAPKTQPHPPKAGSLADAAVRVSQGPQGSWWGAGPMEKAGEGEDPPPLQRRALLVTSCPTQKLAGPPHTEITLGVPTRGEGQEAHSGLAPALSSQCTFPHSLILGCEGFQERT